MADDFFEHTKLLALEQSVMEDIKEYGKGHSDPAKPPQRLETAIQAKLSQIRALTRDLELLVEELDSDEGQQAVARLLSAHAAEYHSIQQAFKAAAVQRRQAAARLLAEERQQLLGTPEAAAKRRQMATEADVVATSEKVTESLRRTRQMMSEELEHTSATLAAMDASHTQLSKTKDEYTGQHGLLKRSQGLLRTIDWQNKSETIMLWFGLALFTLCAAYVAQKRVMYFVPEPLKPMTLAKKTWSIINKGGVASGGSIPMPASPQKAETMLSPVPVPAALPPPPPAVVEKTEPPSPSLPPSTPPPPRRKAPNGHPVGKKKKRRKVAKPVPGSREEGGGLVGIPDSTRRRREPVELDNEGVPDEGVPLEHSEL